jgi:hypothetical protein
MTTKSDQIRELAARKISTAEIAKRLGIRYQHAYNVLKRGNAAPAKKPAHPSLVSTRPILEEKELLKVGFECVAQWKKDATGDLVVAGSLPKEAGVYDFVSEGRALYVGVATMGLEKRLRFYRRPGPTQTTSIRVKAKLLEKLQVVERSIFIRRSHRASIGMGCLSAVSWV